MSEGLYITADLSIPRREFAIRASRSSGPGGQHVNTSSTRVELTWNVNGSTALNEHQRSLIRERLANRIDAAGVLRVVASDTRSQMRNREAAEERFAVLLRRALATRAKRIGTRVPRGAVEARLQAKKRASEKKRNRRGPSEVDYD